MKVPLVTCGFTTYNSELTIQKALLSALNQDYKNIEILIVDDNSTDSTVKKINLTLSKKIKYRLIKHKYNLGVAEARNTLLKNSNGEFLAFFDSDDLSNKKRISKQVANIKNYEKIMSKEGSIFLNSPLCYSDREIIFDENNKIYCKAMFINKCDYYFKEKVIGSLLFCNPFPASSSSGSTATCVLCARVKTLNLLKGFNPKLRRFEDLDLTIKAIMNNVPISRVSEPLVKQYYFNSEYKKNENQYALELIYYYEDWLKSRGLFQTAINFVKFKDCLLNLKFIKTFYYFFLLVKTNPFLFIRRLFSSLNTFLFTVKIKIMKSK